MIERVRASAGSGKTHRLTERFVTLLLDASDAAPPPACGGGRPSGDGPSPYGAGDILAITFTNKAATEMKARVIAALKTLALETSSDPARREASRKAARELSLLLRHSGRLNVRTIDSLLSLLLRLFSLDMGLSPDFETVFDNAGLFDPLYDRLAAGLGTGEPEPAGLFTRAVAVITRGPRTGFLTRGAVLERLRQVFDHLAALDGPLPDADESELRQAAARLSAALRQAARTLLDALDAAGCEAAKNFTTYLERAAGLAEMTAPPESAYVRKKDLADCLKKGSRDLVTPELAALFEAVRVLHAQAARDVALIASALDLLPFVEIARRLLAGLPEMIRREGLLPAALWPARAERSLRGEGGVPDAWCRMGSRLAHLLIDEFQDTSQSQWNVLGLLSAECLSRGGGLFYVGDVKQAIYGWRGGAARLFDSAVAASGLDRLAPVRDENLPCNWRSSRAVVEFNNRFFGLLADPDTAVEAARGLLRAGTPEDQEELARRLGAAYAGCAQALPPDRPAPPGRVTFRRLPGESTGDYADCAREACLELLTTDLLPRLGPSGVAVLTRTNAQAEAVSRWLVAAGIPVVTENSLRLADHPLIQALTAFLAYVDYPGDNLAFFTFVTSAGLFAPVSGIAPQTLHDWAAGRRGSLSAAFARDFPGQWERLVRPYARQAGLTGAYDLVRELVAAYGVIARHPGDEPFVRRFLEVLHVAGERGAGAVSSFLDWWTASGHEEKAPQPEHLDAVRVVTMHKAKGLEYPAVVVPFHHFRADPPADFGRIAIAGREALVPMSEAMGPVQQERRMEACLEQMNLLYVAWTRAALELHLFAPASPLSGKNPVTRAMDALLAAMGIDGETAVFGPPPDAAAPASGPASGPPSGPGPAPAPALADTGSDGAPEAAPAPLAWVMRLKVYRNSVRDVRDSLGFPEKRRGVAAHAAVEALRRMDLDDPQAPLAAAREALAAPECAPPDPALAGEAAREIAAGLSWLLTLPDMPMHLRQGLSERDILDEAGNRHRPDLMVFAPDHTLVIDFKTGRPDPGHAAQVRRYLRLAARLGPRAKSPRGLLVYLDRRETVAVAPE